MDLIDTVNNADLEVIIVLTLATLGYTGYYFIAFSNLWHIKLLKKIDIEKTAVSFFLFQKLSGFLFLGLLPFPLALLMVGRSYFHYELSAFSKSDTISYWLLAALIILPMNFFFARKSENLRRYPQIRIKKWTFQTLLISAGGWFVYLFAYEYLFRGILFFGLLPHLGLALTIAINTAIYALVHMPNGGKETIGAIPLGIVVCLLTFETGSIWAAFLIHLTLAWSNEFLAFYYHPEMHLRDNT